MNAKPIVDIFQKAHEHGGKSVPSVVFETEAGRVKLYRQTARSRDEGGISLNDGGPKGSDIWFGSIDSKTGAFRPRRECPAWVRQLVVDFAANPAGFAAAYGLDTERCCFCATAITTDESKSVGYGPSCAKRYGLPWGKKATAEKRADDLAASLMLGALNGPLAPPVRPTLDEEGTCGDVLEPQDDFESAFDGDPGNDAEAALAAMEGAAGYADDEPTPGAHPPYAAELIVDMIREAKTREDAIKVLRTVFPELPA